MICTIDDIAAIRPIAVNIPDERLTPYIKEAEELRVMPKLGIDLYQDLQDNPTKEGYDILLNGGKYSTGSGSCAKDGYCLGLKAAIAYLVYARFVLQNQVNVTAFGVVSKTVMDGSAMVDSSTLSRVCDQAEKTGMQYLDSCLVYVKAKLNGKRKSGFTSNFTVIGE
jgi:hypothetical protein